MPKQQDYLHTCLALHSDLTDILYGRRQDLKKIEDRISKVRSSRQLTYEDIENMRDPKIWNTDMFGYWPQREEIESVLEAKDWDFWNLPKKEEKAIADLHSVFRQIEPVSLILRFIVPDEYGIVSPPVEKVLGINSFGSHSEKHRPNLEGIYSEKYLAYLHDLRDIREDRGFDRVADVDMALWVLQMGVLEGRLKNSENYGALRDGFRQDSKLRQIQVRNLTKRLFDESNMSRLELAEALVATDVKAAGQIAGVEFERSMKRLAGAVPDDALGKVVDEFCQDHSDLDTDFVVSCKMAVKTRNKAMHPGLKSALTGQEVERLIGAVREVDRMHNNARSP